MSAQIKNKMEYQKQPPRPKKKQKPIPRISKRKAAATTQPNQKDLFLEIWEERDHKSELSGEFLGDEPNAFFFAHILGKGAYPQLKFSKENIMLVTHDEHWQLDQNTHLAKLDDLYKPFFDKAEKLKLELCK